MLQRLSIILAQIKTSNAFENLPDEIHEYIYFLYRGKEITKSMYKNVVSSMQI